MAVSSEHSHHSGSAHGGFRLRRAIWGDYTEEHLARFKRKIGGVYCKIDNKDLIRTGETLYVLGPLPGVNGGIGIFPGEDKPGGSLPPTGSGPETDTPGSRVIQFLKWLKRTFTPAPEWGVGGTGGGDLSVSFASVQYQQIGIIYKPVQVIRWFHAVAGGAVLGWPDDFAVGGSFSPMDFPSAGAIWKSPLYSKLEWDDFRHGFLSFEGSAGFLFGGSLSIMFFGIGMTPTRVLKNLGDFLYEGDPTIFTTLLQKSAPSGVAIFSGVNVVPPWPGCGVAGRIGVMYDREYWGI